MRFLASLVVVAVLCNLTVSVDPGFKARITQKGFNYASSVAQATLAAELKTLAIPNQAGDDGHIHWDLSNIQNRGVTPPSSQIVLDPSHNGLRWTLANLGISLSANWRIKYKKGFFKASTSGSVDMSVSGTTVSVTMSLGMDGSGRPTIGAASCSASVGGVSLNFHGGTGWLINLFKHPLESKVKGLLQGQICNVVTKVINTNGQQALSKLKMTVDVAKYFLLDYRLTAAPTVTGTYLESQEKGEVFWAADMKEAPFAPKPIPESGGVDRMMYLWLTEYMANTFASAGQSHDYLKKNITKDDLPPNQNSFLNTTCKLACIGKLIYQIGQQYPNRQVIVAVTSTSSPQLTIDPSGVSLVLKTNIDMFAEAPEADLAYLVTINLELGFTITAAIQNEKITGKITDHSLKFKVVKSAIGELDSDKLNSVFNGILSLFVIPELNNIAATGMDLPVTGNVQFSNTALQLLPGSIMVATDLVYSPSHAETVHFEKDLGVLKADPQMSFQVVKG